MSVYAVLGSVVLPGRVCTDALAPAPDAVSSRAWCGGCGSDDQSVWCEDCNRVAYCSRECRVREVRNNSRECDGRWKQARGEEDTRELRNVAGHLARNGGFEPTAAPQESPPGNSQDVSKGNDLSGEHLAEGGTGGHKTEELKDNIIDLVRRDRVIVRRMKR